MSLLTSTENLYPELYKQDYLFIGNMSKIDSDSERQLQLYIDHNLNREIMCNKVVKKVISVEAFPSQRGYYADEITYNSKLIPIFMKMQEIPIIVPEKCKRYEILDLAKEI